MFERGDIVWVYFDLPRQTETKVHPAIIISNESVYDGDGVYVCVMMTTDEDTDKFSFVVTQEMLEFYMKKDFSQVRCHLITYIKESHCLKTKLNKMKEIHVNRLVSHINNVTF